MKAKKTQKMVPDMYQEVSFKIANLFLNACQGRLKKRSKIEVLGCRALDAVGIAVITIGSVAAANPHIVQSAYAHLATIGGIVISAGYIICRVDTNIQTNRGIRKELTTQMIETCLAQIDGGYKPRPHAMFFIPGGLRRVLQSEWRRRGCGTTFD